MSRNLTELSGGLVMIPSDMVEPIVQVFEIPDWHSRAECRQEADLFTGSENAQVNDRLQAARDKCADCAVKYLCQLDAVMLPETEGIWGGLDDRQRAAVRAQLPRQRTA